MKFLTHIVAALAAVSITSTSVVKSPSITPESGNFELLILHNNDMHARFEQTSQLSGACTTVDREAGKCYGGFPRVAYVVKEARRAAASGEGPPVLYLNAGDTYTGTAWFTIYKWKIAAEFINALQPDAVSLGNHEFDEAVEGVVPFIRNVSAPILAANLILDKVPELQNEPNLHNSTVLTVKGVKIGIIGYLTPETQFLAPKNKVEYEDEVIALKREVAKLKNQDVKIIIALGHSGFIKDLEIANKVEDLDLVIGGHSNTFLWNKKSTESPEYPQGHYPTWVTQASGRKVPVVQAYAYTKYMGKLNLVFNSDGELIECDGEPMLLNQDIPKDPELLDLVKKYHAKVDIINNEVVGSSLVFLDGLNCRLGECNMGNVFTDSMLYYTKKYYNDQYPDANIAVVQGGRIRASITKQGERPFKLTRGDLITVLPFTDTLSVVTMNGTILWQALEHSIDTWRLIDSTGQFLQVSGLKVVYDLAKPPGSRVVSAQAVCSNCSESSLADIQPNYYYKLIMCTFLAEGGDGYTMFERLEKEPVMYDEVISMLDYLKVYSPINPTVTGRIILLNKEQVTDGLSNASNTGREGRAVESRATTLHSTSYMVILLTSIYQFY